MALNNLNKVIVGVAALSAGAIVVISSSSSAQSPVWVTMKPGDDGHVTCAASPTPATLATMGSPDMPLVQCPRSASSKPSAPSKILATGQLGGLVIITGSGGCKPVQRYDAPTGSIYISCGGGEHRGGQPGDRPGGQPLRPQGSHLAGFRRPQPNRPDHKASPRLCRHADRDLHQSTSRRSQRLPELLRRHGHSGPWDSVRADRRGHGAQCLQPDDQYC
jgi:hypothetical protein